MVLLMLHHQTRRAVFSCVPKLDAISMHATFSRRKVLDEQANSYFRLTNILGACFLFPLFFSNIVLLQNRFRSASNPAKMFMDREAFIHFAGGAAGGTTGIHSITIFY